MTASDSQILRCSYCNALDNGTCAYPSEHQSGCLLEAHRKRMKTSWETMMRYQCGERIVMSKDAALKSWARRELIEGMQWLDDEFRYEKRQLMWAEDDGMIVWERSQC